MPIISGGGSGSAVTFLATAAKTAGFTTNSATAVQVTGLTATVNVGTGARIKISVAVDGLYNDTALKYAILSVWDGTVGSGTQVGQCTSGLLGASVVAAGGIMVVLTPSAGAHTYNVGLAQNSGGNAGITAGATSPATLLIEKIA